MIVEGSFMYYFRLGSATLMPMLITLLFKVLDRKTGFSKLRVNTRQLIIGITFGALAIASTEFGVPTEDNVIVNVRDAGPLCAGLLFGAPAGLISGTMGGLHRWLYVYWGGGEVTRLACSLSTFLAGFCGGMMRKKLFDNGNAGVLSGFGIGTTMEVLHMLLILATNLNDVEHAFNFVQACSFPMILCNGIAVSLSAIVYGFPHNHEEVDFKVRRISYDFAFWLLVCVIIAFLTTSTFTQQVVYRITTDDTVLYRYVTIYLVVFMEILIYTALFIQIYRMLQKKVVLNLHKVNEGLNAITNGNLDTVIDVRTYKEFSELSDDVNATVNTLKKYIHEAEDRMNIELEVARQIQKSALPSVFPPYPGRPDFDIFASMDAAKEVGGDFYDFYLLNRFNLIFMVADVSGKGVPAAMFMMTAKTLIKGLAESGIPVNEVFSEANSKLCEANDAGMFITAWMGKLDLRTGKLEFVNAGHNPPLIRHRNGKFEYLRTRPNFILAGMDETRYRMQTIQLNPGDEIFLYTDGVTEATNAENELFGEQRLEKSLANHELEPHNICANVKLDVSMFVGDAPQSDDITMLCVRLNALQDKFFVTTHPDDGSYGIVQAFLDDRLKSSGIPTRAVSRMQIVADEIWSNIVHYSGAIEASVILRREGDTIFMDFTDDGVQYNPLDAETPDTTLCVEDRPIGGLGLHMVRKMTSSMEYKYIEGKNMLTLGFEMKE